MFYLKWILFEVYYGQSKIMMFSDEQDDCYLLYLSK